MENQDKIQKSFKKKRKPLAPFNLWWNQTDMDINLMFWDSPNNLNAWL